MNVKNIGASVMLTGLLYSAGAQADQIKFSCPKSGTVAEYGSIGSVKYLGEASDPYHCHLINLFGKARVNLFNFYNIEGDDTAAKNGMIGLFSGQKTVSFVYVSKVSRNQFLDTWRVLRRETISIGDKQINAIVFERDVQGQLSNNHHGIWNFWFDPQTGIWVKHTVSVLAGTASGLGYNVDVSRIVEPK